MKKVFIKGVRGYQKVISPMFAPSCRYYPTCSNYMIQALEEHGALKGSIMGTARILRCHPFLAGGYDPVPKRFTIRRNKEADVELENLRKIVNEKTTTDS